MARFTSGWVKVHRKVVEEDIGQRGNFTLGLFVRLLRMANWRDGNAPVGGQRVKLVPGQLATGLRELSPNIEEDPYLHRVRNALGYLEKRGTITQATSNQGRIITICNWDEYQFSDSEVASDPASEAQAERKQGASGAQHIEEVKKLRREEIYSCVEIWGATLARMEIQKSATLDEGEIARLIQRHGLEKTKLALLGAGFEASSENYDPAKNVSIRRLGKPDTFEKFVNLGAKHQPVERQAIEWDLKAGSGKC